MRVVKFCIARVSDWWRTYRMLVAGTIEFLNPYLSVLLFWQTYQQRGRLAFGGEVVVPALLFLLSRLIKARAMRDSAWNGMPIPPHRFTTVEGDGMVTIPTRRTQELILYVAELEDWIQKTYGTWQ